MMAQLLKELSALTGGPEFKSQHSCLTVYNHFRRSDALFWSPQVPTCMCTYAHGHTHIHINTEIKVKYF